MRELYLLYVPYISKKATSVISVIIYTQFTKLLKKEREKTNNKLMRKTNIMVTLSILTKERKTLLQNSQIRYCRTVTSNTCPSSK